MWISIAEYGTTAAGRTSSTARFSVEAAEYRTRRTLREYSKGNDIRTYKAWTCKEHHKGRRGNGCTMRTICERDLLAAISLELGYEQFNPVRFARETEKVEVDMKDVRIS